MHGVHKWPSGGSLTGEMALNNVRETPKSTGADQDGTHYLDFAAGDLMVAVGIRAPENGGGVLAGDHFPE